MKAAVFHKMGDIRVYNVEDPRIEQPDDIILKVTSTAICGSDLRSSGLLTDAALALFLFQR